MEKIWLQELPIDLKILFGSPVVTKEFLKMLNNLYVSSFKARKFDLAEAFQWAIDEIEAREEEFLAVVEQEADRIMEEVVVAPKAKRKRKK